ncbi:hypothetical protein [uncultured Cocleimonas sp.]|uniref:hypothetical protein n=1 Tax=uncultured Cocleimonas sp. TaxID=1051587 RepID=UPI00260AEBB3|nr:hypothetical protein [uncultured Cocleimonas sp.]
MKKRSVLKKTIYASGITSGIGLLMLAGCGGGSSSDTTETGTSTLDAVSIEKLASRVVEEGDCVAVSGASSARISDKLASTDEVSTPPLLALAIENVINGLLGGTLTKTGEHLDGTDTLTYTYSDFANPVGELAFSANGTASVIDYGVPGDFGPIMSNKTIDTTDEITITKESNTESRPGLLSRILLGTYKLKIAGLDRTYAQEFADPDSYVIDDVTLVNADTSSEYKISNLKGKGYFNPSQAALMDIEYTYNSPDVGPFTVKSDSLTVSLDTMKIPSSAEGTLIMTATDGTQAEVVLENTGTVKIFSVDGTTKTLTSEVDCSGLVH